MTLVIIMLISAVIPASAYSVKQQDTADALNELGLFQGMGGTAGYALDQNLTRAQGITLLVRMIGKEAEALSTTYTTPFVDVPTWASGYVGYAYTNAITNGMGPDKFGSDVQLADNMFLTLVLRALGYSDAGENPEFTWDKPYELAKKVGLIDRAAADASFTRGDAVVIFWNAMNINMVETNTTLAQSLIAQGVFTEQEFKSAQETQKNGRTSGTENDLERDETPSMLPTTDPNDEANDMGSIYDPSNDLTVDRD